MDTSLNFETFSKERGVKIISWNIRSLYNKFSEFEANIDKLQPEIICISETWLNEKISDNWLLLDNFLIYRLDRCTKRKDGGLCIYVTNKYICNAVKYNHLNSSNADIEIMIVEVCLPSTTPMVIMNCYRPPAGNVENALTQIQHVLDSIPLTNEIYFMGDLNLDYSCKGSPTHKKLKLLERTYQLHQFIESPTRISKNSASLIDHIYTNSHLVSKAGTLPIYSSDHYPCYIIRKKPKTPVIMTSFVCRKLKHFDNEFFRNRLEEIDWRPYYESSDPNVAWDVLLRNILTVLDSHYPEIEHKNVPSRAKWLSSEIFELILKRDNAFELARLSNDPKDWETAKKLRNKVVDVCCCAKNEFTRVSLEENKLNPKKFWAKINSIWGDPKKKKDSNEYCILRDPNTQTDGSKLDTPNIFNNFFCTVAPKLQSKITPLSPTEQQKLNSTNSMIHNKPLNPDIPKEKFAFRDITTVEL